MPSLYSSKLFFFFFFLIFLSLRTCNARSIFTFKMHHRYSDPVKKWSNSTGMLSPAPEKGTVEYYSDLADRDRLLLLHHLFRGRKLSDSDASLAFADGNSTFRISSLGLYVSLYIYMYMIEVSKFGSLKLKCFLFFGDLVQFALHDGAIRDARSEVYGSTGHWE